MGRKRERRDYTPEATALFARFAQRHRLNYEAHKDAPVEVMWEFPVQPKLHHPIILALQNSDELNFGVGDFWSYFFPFEKKCAAFESVIDKWVEGKARIVPEQGVMTQSLQLQTWDGTHWRTEASANSLGRNKKPLPPILMNAER